VQVGQLVRLFDVFVFLFFGGFDGVFSIFRLLIFWNGLQGGQAAFKKPKTGKTAGFSGNWQTGQYLLLF